MGAPGSGPAGVHRRPLVMDIISMVESTDRIKSGHHWPVRSGGWSSRGTGADTFLVVSTVTPCSSSPNRAPWPEPSQGDLPTNPTVRCSTAHGPVPAATIPPGSHGGSSWRGRRPWPGGWPAPGWLPATGCSCRGRPASTWPSPTSVACGWGWSWYRPTVPTRRPSSPMWWPTVVRARPSWTTTAGRTAWRGWTRTSCSQARRWPSRTAVPPSPWTGPRPMIRPSSATPRVPRAAPRERS